jgi:hypothetical protein
VVLTLIPTSFGSTREVARMRACDMRGSRQTKTPDIAEPVIGRAFARPVGSSGLGSLSRVRPTPAAAFVPRSLAVSSPRSTVNPEIVLSISQGQPFQSRSWPGWLAHGASLREQPQLSNHLPEQWTEFWPKPRSVEQSVFLRTEHPRGGYLLGAAIDRQLPL